MTDPLTAEETLLWHLWKGASETVRARIGNDLQTETGHSDQDYGVLTRLVDLGAGSLRQNELGASMGWHRSRLSKHLTRMEDRHLLSRAPSGDGIEVAISTTGLDAISRARTVHAEAVRRHLIQLIPTDQRAGLIATLEAVLRTS